MAVSTDSTAPCNEPSPQPYSPASVDTFTNSQLHQLIQYLNVSIFVICIDHPFCDGRRARIRSLRERNAPARDGIIREDLQHLCLPRVYTRFMWRISGWVLVASFPAAASPGPSHRSHSRSSWS